ncbi:MAG: hypothetical protein K5787_11335 [Lentisphaeria bacterium]|nr:hypothetical protein [Lentisphaeria bacterium]
MCKALDDLWQDGKKEGRIEGRKEERKRARLQRKESIRNLIRAYRNLGDSFERIHKLLMASYHLSAKQAERYILACT